MISKKVISDIVSKYSLGNSIEKVKWIITDEKLIIHFINDSKNLVGYVDYRKKIGLLHKRRVYMSIEGDDVRGEDTLLVPLGAVPLSNNEKPYDIRFHFHPDVRVSLSQDQKSALLIQAGKTGWRFRTDHGPIKIENSLYLGTGSTPRKCQQIVISGNAFCSSWLPISINDWYINCIWTRSLSSWGASASN